MVKYYKDMTTYERKKSLKSALQVFDIKVYPEEFEFDFAFFKKIYQKILNDSRFYSLKKDLKKVIQDFSFRRTYQEESKN